MKYSSKGLVNPSIFSEGGEQFLVDQFLIAVPAIGQALGKAWLLREVKLVQCASLQA